MLLQFLLVLSLIRKSIQCLLSEYPSVFPPKLWRHACQQLTLSSLFQVHPDQKVWVVKQDPHQSVSNLSPGPNLWDLLRREHTGYYFVNASFQLIVSGAKPGGSLEAEDEGDGRSELCPSSSGVRKCCSPSFSALPEQPSIVPLNPLLSLFTLLSTSELCPLYHSTTPNERTTILVLDCSQSAFPQQPEGDTERNPNKLPPRFNLFLLRKKTKMLSLVCQSDPVGLCYTLSPHLNLVPRTL